MDDWNSPTFHRDHDPSFSHESTNIFYHKTSSHQLGTVSPKRSNLDESKNVVCFPDKKGLLVSLLIACAVGACLYFGVV